MNAFFGGGLLTALLYGIFIDGTFFKLYFVVLALYTFICNSSLCINQKEITKRKNITITSWDAPGDPSAYLVMEYDVTKALPYIKKLNEEQSQHKVTMTHLMSKAICNGMCKMRRDIGHIKWGYF